MLTPTDTALPFPDSLISRSQSLAGAIESASPSVADLQRLLTDLPPEASPQVRFTVRQVFMRVFGRFARALDGARDGASIEAFIAWSSTDASSEHWRDDLFDLVDVWRAAQTMTRDDATSVVAGVADVRIRHAINALDRRYAEPRLALGDLALAANLSLCQIARLLKRQTGRGFVAHLHERRIAAARMHLTQTTLSIKQIADRVGYRSASEFGRHFRRSSGVTPREYRGTRELTGELPHAKSHDQ